MGGLLATHSTSTTTLTTNEHLAIQNGANTTWDIGNQIVLSTSAIVTPTISTTYFLLCNVVYGTSGRIQYNKGNSSF